MSCEGRNEESSREVVPEGEREACSAIDERERQREEASSKGKTLARRRWVFLFSILVFEN